MTEDVDRAGAAYGRAVERAEQEVLGSALSDQRAVGPVVAELDSTDFHRPAHQEVHRAVRELFAAGRPVSDVAVAALLAGRAPEVVGRGGDGRDVLDTVGGTHYLRRLVDRAVGPSVLASQVRNVADASRWRTFEEELARVAQLAADLDNRDDNADRVERGLRAAQEVLSWRSGNRWPEPKPLSGRLPEFPAEALPGSVRRVVESVAASTQTPPDLAAFSALAVLSAATRGNWQVRVRPGWTEQTALYLVALSDSGTRKSAVVSAVGGALTAITRNVRAAEAETFAAATAHYKILEARAKAALDAAAKAGAGHEDEAAAEAEDLAVRLADATPPRRTRLTCDDTTPEELARLMEGQGGPMAVLTAEGGLLGTLAGRYSKDGTANLDLVLKAYNGEHVMVDRVSREPLDVERPFLALGFVVQPDVIAAATRVREFTTRGLLPRMLFAWPATTVGTRPNDAPEVPPDVEAEWTAVVGKVFAAGQDAATGGTPGTVLLDADARASFDAWRWPHEHRLHPDLGDLADVTAWASKLPGTLVRVAALLALAERPGDAHPRVTGPEMSAALALAPYLVAHAREVLASGASRRDQLGTVLDWILRNHRSATRGVGVNFDGQRNASYAVIDGESRNTAPTWTLSVRELYRGLNGQSWVRGAADVEDALLDLEDLGYVRRVAAPPTKRGRPESPRYQPNPRFLAAP
jgi:hypothetical protein